MSCVRDRLVVDVLRSKETVRALPGGALFTDLRHTARGCPRDLGRYRDQPLSARLVAELRFPELQLAPLLDVCPSIHHAMKLTRSASCKPSR